MLNERCRPKRLTGKLRKVTVRLTESDWHDYATETLWAEEVAPDRYRLRNVPFLAYGLSCEDVVLVENGGDGTLKVSGQSIRGGHSTYRVFLEEGVAVGDMRFADLWANLERTGCTYERATARLLAIDVPGKVDIRLVYSLLERGEKAGVWNFEEGYCGHPVPSPGQG